MSKNITKKILVIGSGAREHAICQAFSRSKYQPQIFIIQGNAGTAKIAKNISDIAITDFKKITEFCLNHNIDFVFVGPEQPLTLGLVDYLESKRIKVFGPSQKSALLEGSKIFMKKIASDYHIPTAKYQTFQANSNSVSQALQYAKELGFPCVIKTDGLASGKGVIIANNFAEAQNAITEIFAGKFGEAGKKIIIEEFLEGFEVSYFVICDGKNFLPLGFAHDHKKVGEGETGLNTGGMGTFSPSLKISQELETRIITKIINPTLQAMITEGCEFRGILFAGLMIKNNDAKLLEFNIRLGDPETQVLLPRITTDFVDLIEHAIDKKLANIKIEFDDNKKLVCVVICAKGYPEEYGKGHVIKNLSEIEDKIEKKYHDNIQILHAGTSFNDKEIIATGGRVLNVVASATSFKEAKKMAYEVVDQIGWEQGFVRRDIASSVD
ncbi:phosphoribosylamine--glycine ligase [Alphaproteobacteria bacterium]|nr:phosphoribosylamine--glycine ligase [Alphaproteobacteria bacterium]